MRAPLVYLTILVIATCGLVYELVTATLASYVLGDAVTQFSTVIGVYLSAMGLGSFLSRYVQRGLARRFLRRMSPVVAQRTTRTALKVLLPTPPPERTAVRDEAIRRPLHVIATGNSSTDRQAFNLPTALAVDSRGAVRDE